MPEWLSKVLVQNAVAVMVIAGCLVIVGVGTYHEYPKENLQVINKFFDMCLVGVIGWLFTQSKKAGQ